MILIILESKATFLRSITIDCSTSFILVPESRALFNLHPDVETEFLHSTPIFPSRSSHQDKPNTIDHERPAAKIHLYPRTYDGVGKCHSTLKQGICSWPVCSCLLVKGHHSLTGLQMEVRWTVHQPSRWDFSQLLLENRAIHEQPSTSYCLCT